MSLYSFVLVNVALVACKKDECPTVRKEVAHELKLAYEGVQLERDKLELDAGNTTRAAADDARRAEDLEQRFKLLEQSMDCLDHKDDCCARLSKLSIQERTPIQSSAMQAADHVGLPVQIVVLMDPLGALTENIDAIGTGAKDPKVITPWCTKVRDALSQFRAAAPAAWKTATEEANKRAAEMKAAVAAHDVLVDTLAAWAKAVDKSQAVTIPTDTGPSEGFARGRRAIQRYQNACH